MPLKFKSMVLNHWGGGLGGAEHLEEAQCDFCIHNRSRENIVCKSSSCPASLISCSGLFFNTEIQQHLCIIIIAFDLGINSTV